MFIVLKMKKLDLSWFLKNYVKKNIIDYFNMGIYFITISNSLTNGQ